MRHSRLCQAMHMAKTIAMVFRRQTTGYKITAYWPKPVYRWLLRRGNKAGVMQMLSFTPDLFLASQAAVLHTPFASRSRLWWRNTRQMTWIYALHWCAAFVPIMAQQVNYGVLRATATEARNWWRIFQPNRPSISLSLKSQPVPMPHRLKRPCLNWRTVTTNAKTVVRVKNRQAARLSNLNSKAKARKNTYPRTSQASSPSPSTGRPTAEPYPGDSDSGL